MTELISKNHGIQRAMQMIEQEMPPNYRMVIELVAQCWWISVQDEFGHHLATIDVVSDVGTCLNTLILHAREIWSARVADRG